MKYLYILLFSTLALGMASCAKTDTELLARDWQADYIIMEGQRVDIDAGANIMSLKEDGTGSITDDGNTLDISWSYDPDKKELTIGYKGMENALPSTGSVEKLTEEELMWVVPFQDKKVNMHYTPVK